MGLKLLNRADFDCTNCGEFIGPRHRAVWKYNTPYCSRSCQIEHEEQSGIKKPQEMYHERTATRAIA